MNGWWSTVTSCLHWNLDLRFQTYVLSKSEKTQRKKVKAKMTHVLSKRLYFKTTNKTHKPHEKKTGFLYIHISDILYLTTSTLHLFEAEWFLLPPIAKAEGRVKWRRCGQEEINQKTKITFGIKTVRPVIAMQRFTAAVQPASCSRTESSLHPPYKPVKEENEKQNMVNMLHFLLIIICTHLGLEAGKFSGYLKVAGLVTWATSGTKKKKRKGSN